MIFSCFGNAFASYRHKTVPPHVLLAESISLEDLTDPEDAESPFANSSFQHEVECFQQRPS